MKILTLIAVVLLIAGYAFAASIDGRWTGSFEAEGFGTLPLGYDFKADGDKLTGTADDMDGPVSITNGKIEGNNISFEYSISMGMSFKVKGVLSGDKLKLTWTNSMGGPPGEATVTRQK